jgi:hypothetical protein
MSKLEIALAFAGYPSLKRWEGTGRHEQDLFGNLLGNANPLNAMLPAAELVSLYLGSEFCEFLMPSAEIVKRGIQIAKGSACRFALVTPVASDGVIDHLKTLLPLLPAGAELIVNDWGVASLAQREFPRIKLVAGRLLCKMIKDPRLDSRVWVDMYPHGLGGTSFRRMLDKLGIERMELDVPPFAVPELFRDLVVPAAVHAPCGYVSKGRQCKIGSIALPLTQKFSSGRECRRECLTYAAVTQREGRPADVETYQRGNTLFYSHSKAMSEAVLGALAQGWLRRLVLQAD